MLIGAAASAGGCLILVSDASSSCSSSLGIRDGVLDGEDVDAVGCGLLDEGDEEDDEDEECLLF